MAAAQTASTFSLSSAEARLFMHAWMLGFLVTLLLIG